MFEPEIEIFVRGKSNFDQPFLHFNVKKKIYVKSYFKWTFSIWLEILNTRHCLLIKQLIHCYNKINLHISIFE